MTMDVIDYQVFGDDMQYVEVELGPGEAAVGEAGALYYMQDGIAMDTVFGDGSDCGGVLGSLLGAGKRLLGGASLFTTVFANQADGRRRLAFAAATPGKIVPLHLLELGGVLYAQKDSFLAGAKGVSLGLAWQRRIGAGLFGGEGFVMQKLEGDGYVFLHAGGALTEMQLRPGEVLRVDAGCVAAYQPGVDFDIEYVGKLKSALFGGEGLFFAKLTGPGRVWLQSLPLARLADRLAAAAPRAGGESK
ncbi:TIGR00266 family protein [Chromobacterium sp. ATCC 53434]|nr:TIGR00266 family protein [Chromobacterium sp. ATCC 53434]AUH53028.1 TIGR00266 family protein [Chromobacterium sp. ATCC 53434]